MKKKILGILWCVSLILFGAVSISYATTVEIDSQNNQIWGREWPAGATVTLTIDDPDTPGPVDYTDSQTASSEIIWAAYNVHFNMDLAPFQIEPGQTVALSDGTITRTHTVTNLTVSTSDADTDTVSGTAAPGSIVEVRQWADDCPGGVSRWETADGGGNWTANFAVPGDEPGEDICDVTPGTPIWVFQPDADGDTTAIFWPTCKPRFNVQVSMNAVWSYEWAEGTTITLAVDDPVTPANPDYSASMPVAVDADPNNWGHCGKTSAFFNLGDAFTIQPDHAITVTDGAALKNHIVKDVVVTDIDIPNSTVSGTAEPNAALRVNVWNPAPPHDSLDVTADGAGNWTADFSAINPFTEGTSGAVFHCDVDDDCTVVQWRLLSRITADPQNNQIWGVDWPAGDTVTLTVEDPDTPASPDHTDSQTAFDGDLWAGNNVQFNMDLVPFQLEPDQIVTLQSGATTKTLTLTPLTVTSSDADTDIVSGTAAPGSIIHVRQWSDDCPGGISRWETADGAGNWAANFAVPGDEPDENICDITPGTPIWVDQTDDGGDATAIFWPTCNPRFDVQVSMNQLWSYEWAEGTTITLAVDDPVTPANPDYSASMPVAVDDDPNNWGYCGKTSAFFNLGGAFTIQPDHVITVTDGDALKNHIVKNVVVTDIDIPNSTVSGTAEPNAALRVNVWNPAPPHDSLDVTADGAGNWSADFSTINPFTESTGGAVFDCDVDDDCTVVQWNAATANDSDGDGLSDDDEINVHGTDPNNPDSDGDGLWDGEEVNVHNTNPNNPDSDGDKLSDGYEVEQGFEPDNPSNYPDLPVSGFIHHVREPNGDSKTYLEVIIGSGFVFDDVALESEIASITVRKPDGNNLATGPAGWTYFSQWRDFWLALDGPPPQLGVYSFDIVTSSDGFTGSDTDTQTVIHNIPNPDVTTFSPAHRTVVTAAPTLFSWAAVDYTATPIYYRLIIDDGTNRVYSTGRELNMLSYEVPAGTFEVGTIYYWHVRAVDAADYNLLENRATSYKASILMADATSDYDGDEVFDVEDNCPLIANPNQGDTNINDIGDACEGLIAYYPFNGSADDESWNRNDGTVIGPTLTTDRFGNSDSAYSFDGVNDYIRANADNLPTAERTVSLWFFANNNDRMVHLGYGGSGPPGTSWFMGMNAWGQSIIYMSSHYNNNTIKYFYPQPPVGSWYHFVVSTDETGTKLYINGEEKATNGVFVTNTIVPDRDLSIGVCVNPYGIAPYVDSNVGYFDGIIDDIRIYNRALSGAEIQSLYIEGADQLDSDGDGVPDASDNCPDDPNPDQADSDGDGIGDACEALQELEYGSFSSHFESGYYIQFHVQDASQLADSITVTGPGIVTPLPLTYGAYRPGEWWSVPNLDLGLSPPAPPLTYTFHIFIGGEEYTRQTIIKSFVAEFATNLSPSGTASGAITFSWTAISDPAAQYQVQLNDSSTRIWDSPLTADTSIAYSGPPLIGGATYSYFISARDSLGNASLAAADFVYTASVPDDTDGDGVADADDNCPDDPNADQANADGDALGDVCDACPNDAENDVDGDGVCGDVDNCPAVANPGQEDIDGDGIGDACDALTDSDGDGVADAADNCPNDPNADQANADGDALGDVCDACPNDADNDADVDSVCGDTDNCPITFNPEQEDFDEDTIGQACDNCPKVPNTNQQDSDGDGMGNACETGGGFEEQLIVVDTDPQLPGEALPKQPGEPLWVTATFENNSPVPIEAIKPDCFNTSFHVKDSDGTTLPPRYRIRAAYGIPKDVVILPPGPFSVICDLADMFHPEVLRDPVPADGEPEPYTVVATYSNDIQDPDLNPVTGECSSPPCSDLFVGAVTSPPATVKIEGTSLESMVANCSVSPKEWNPQWAVVQGPVITVSILTITDSEGDPVGVENVKPSSIRLNGKLKIIPGSERIENDKLLVDFDGSEAVKSMGTVVPGQAITTIQGNFTSGKNVFSGQGPVYILYPIDIKPGSYPNSINPGAKGTVPVAILGTPGFDAATVDAKTVTLEGAPVKMKKKDEPMVSLEDVNKDGYPDMVVHIDTQKLKIEKEATVAYLTGKTIGETPADTSDIKGVDSVEIVKIKNKDH